jgi:tetratricopeptide (TPR) repeat protein
MRTNSFILIRIALFIGLFVLALYQLRVAVIAQTVYSAAATSKAVRKYQTDPRVLVEYGKEEIFLGDHENSRKWLQKALRANPVYIPAWLTLAELENNTGNTDQAVQILEYLDELMEDVISWRWEKAMLAYLLGREDIVKADLSWLLQQEKLTWQTQQKVLNFAFSLWPEPAELVKEIGHENSTLIFLHALRIKDIDTASFFWAMTDHTQLENIQVLQYINLLIDNQKIDAATMVWQKFYPTTDLLYNGNFSLPLTNGGFGWRIWKKVLEDNGVELTLEEQKKTALHLHFNGEQNINLYQIRQIIPLSAGQTFTLSGEMRSKELSTDQRPFLELMGKDCSLRAATEMVEPNQDWTPFSLSFTIPEECQQGLMLRLRRLPSRKIDSLIKGDFWVTNLFLRKNTRALTPR